MIWGPRRHPLKDIGVVVFSPTTSIYHSYGNVAGWEVVRSSGLRLRARSRRGGALPFISSHVRHAALSAASHTLSPEQATSPILNLTALFEWFPLISPYFSFILLYSGTPASVRCFLFCGFYVVPLWSPSFRSYFYCRLNGTLCPCHPDIKLLWVPCYQCNLSRGDTETNISSTVNG